MTKKTILIVDDDKDLVQLLAQRCQRIGLHVQTAHSVLMAMALLDQGLPDLVCLDINMPSGNGLSICEMMATDDEAAQIPVIVLTGRKDAETIRRCGQMCAYYVHKSTDVWHRVQPVIYELVDLDPPVPSGWSQSTKQSEQS